MTRPGKPASLVAIVPAISPGASTSLRALSSVLSNLDVDLLVVSNGLTLTHKLESIGVPFVASGSNAGFGQSIERGLQEFADWTHVFILNDDIEIEAPSLQAALATIRGEDCALPRVWFLDAEDPRRVPRLADVLTNLALLNRLFKRDTHAISSFGTVELPPDTYKSFSAVAISRAAWDLLRGFDPEYIFTYEDADFVRRGRAAGVAMIDVRDAGIRHEHSASSGRHIASVLPVSAWSACVFATRELGGRRNLARLLCVIALVGRIPLAPLTNARTSSHLLGIFRAIRCLTLDQKPSLPAYETL